MNSFLKNMLTLMTFTVIGQVIIFLTLPLISRIYTPDQFGIYSSLIAVISILGVTTTLRYDIAIALTNDETERNTLYKISSSLNLIISILIALGLSLSNYFINYFTLSEILFITFSVYLIGKLQIFNNLSVSLGYFKPVSLTKLTQSLSQVVIQLVGYFSKNNILFLYLGYIMGKTNGLLYLYRTNKNSIKQQEIDKDEFIRVLKKFKDFPFFSFPSALIGSVSSNIIIIVLVAIYGGFYGGIYGFLTRLISAPLQLLSKSYNSALYKYSQNSSIKSIYKLYLLTSGLILGVFSIGILTYTNIDINIFQIIFGNEWAYINEIFFPFLLMTMAQFSVVPVSEILTVLKKQKLRLYWDILKLFSLSILFIIIIINDYKFDTFIVLYCSLMSVLYLILHSLIIFSLHHKIKVMKQER